MGSAKTILLGVALMGIGIPIMIFRAKYVFRVRREIGDTRRANSFFIGLVMTCAGILVIVGTIYMAIKGK